MNAGIVWSTHTRTHHLDVNIKYIKMQNLLNFETVA